MNCNWKLIAKVAAVVFLSEMGDKTQVTTLLLAGAKPLYVLYVALGSASALVCTALLEVTIGAHILGRHLKPAVIRLASCLAFIALGILLILGVIGRIELPA
ncbi:MAG: TMEM165/GDT1 family protein [Acetobacteraceae bacterium]|nr:TMEM165/GDT1 family protein [Acetobacteraceae bacterium]